MQLRIIFIPLAVAVQPTVDPAVQKIAEAAADEDEESSVARAEAVAADTQAIEHDLEASRADVKHEADQVKVDAAEIAEGISSAERSATDAQEFTNEVQKALADAKKEAAEAPAKAKKLAAEEVHKELKAAYHKLESWRETHLANPHAAARRAELQAVKPFNRAIKALYGRLAEYQLAAQGAAGQASSTQAKAQALASDANAKMETGDVITANMDMQQAGALAQQAARLEARAKTLYGQVKTINNLVPQYIASAYQAAWRAAYEQDPQFVPPPPYMANFAFTPAPTFLQRRASK